MALTFSPTVQNAILDSIEGAIGVSAVLKIRTGAPPTNTGLASTGTVLATLSLPSDWMANASAGSKSKLGTWEDTSADAGGSAAHYEICAADGSTVHMRGTVGATGSGSDLEVDNTSFNINQDFKITNYTWNAPGKGS